MNTFEQVRVWAYRTQTHMHEALPLFERYFSTRSDQYAHLDPILGQLSTTCLMTTESSILLVSALRLWDAEILVRAVLEGTFRFLYLSEPADDEVRSARCAEYSEVLFDIHRLKRHQRAEQLLSLLPDGDSEEWRPIRDLVMKDEEFAELRSRFPKNTRRLIEDRWSFFPLMKHLAKSPTIRREALVGFAFAYGMASHHVHMDGVGVNMIWDRASRERERSDAIDLAHGARLLSELMQFLLLRIDVAYDRKGLNKGELHRWHASLTPLTQEFDSALAAWHQIEYERYG